MKAIILAVLLTTTSVAAHAERIMVPAGNCVSSPFGPRFLPQAPQAGGFHNGIDLPAAYGTPVLAVASGKVLKVQYLSLGGVEVLIQHGGFVGIYSHLGTVSVGDKAIEAGEQIGTVGRTGLSFGPHLFFGMLKDGHAVDPAPILGTPRCGIDTGPIIRQMTAAEILAMGGKLPPTRAYAPAPAFRRTRTA